jgi:hypothetical protein
MLTTPPPERVLSRQLLDVLIRAGLIAVLAVFCFRIFAPLLNLMVWTLLLAITLYPRQVRLGTRSTAAYQLVRTRIDEGRICPGINATLEPPPVALLAHLAEFIDVFLQRLIFRRFDQ